MKPLIATTACFITATVVCAQFSNVELGSASIEPESFVSVAAASASMNPAGDFSPTLYGAFGAAAMGLLIATRRQRVSA